MAKVLIVQAPYYEDIIEEMAMGAVEVLDEAGHDYDRLNVTGAFEIPGAIAQVDASPQSEYDGYIALGCVLRGETDHYDHICRESANGLQMLAIQQRLAIGYGILTVDSAEQAWDRANREEKNKGAEAALACLKMMEIHDLFPSGKGAGEKSKSS